MFGRGVFLKGKSFHSIVIVVPLHVSKFCWVLKKLTAQLWGRFSVFDASADFWLGLCTLRQCFEFPFGMQARVLGHDAWAVPVTWAFLVFTFEMSR
jgi:hypothetical protein